MRAQLSAVALAVALTAAGVAAAITLAAGEIAGRLDPLRWPMKFHIQIGAFSMCWGAAESSDPKVFDDSAEARAKRTAERERDWKVRQATQSASGGQFGFGRTDLTAIEHPANRWETGGRIR